MKKNFDEDLIRIIISTVLFIISFIFNNSVKVILLILSYIIISLEVYKNAFLHIKEGEFFDENLLMIIATIGAFFISSYTEAVMVMLLFEVGEYLSDLAITNSRNSITKLMDLRSDTINIIKNDEIIKTPTAKAKVADIFIVTSGEKIPLDGIVIEGTSHLDTSALTGESHPKKVGVGDSVISGSINKESILKIKATSTLKNSTANRIIELLENSPSRKSSTETFIEHFSEIYTKVIILIALVLLLIQPLFGRNLNDSLYTTLIFLVTSCPCALVISIPLGYFCGIGKASKEGILIKGSKELDLLSTIDYLALDKTGTITEGVFEVTKIESKTVSPKELINLVAIAESNSNHPIAIAIKNYTTIHSKKAVMDFKEIPGKGISCKIDRKNILIGNAKLLADNNIDIEEISTDGTIIYIALDQTYAGYVVISDKIKKSSYELKKLKDELKDIIILSGDSQNIVSSVAKKLNIKTYYSNLLPEDKVNKIKELQNIGQVMFVGDGINDAPVLKLADVGISMGTLGSDAAIEASDIVIMQDDLTKIKTVLDISKVTKRKVMTNITIALVIKFIVLLLGTLGITTIWMAVFADVGVTIISILNVLTIFNYKL